MVQYVPEYEPAQESTCPPPYKRGGLLEALQLLKNRTAERKKMEKDP